MDGANISSSDNQLALSHAKVWPIGYLQMTTGSVNAMLSRSPQILLLGKSNYSKSRYQLFKSEMEKNNTRESSIKLTVGLEDYCSPFQSWDTMVSQSAKVSRRSRINENQLKT